MTALREAMTGKRLSQLLEGLAAVPPEEDCEVTGLSLDSRQVQPNSLFLACSGGGAHGLQFLQQALDNGAVAVAWEPNGNWSGSQVEQIAAGVSVPLLRVENLRRSVSSIAGRFFDHPSRALSVIGYTGTNGKTSSTQFLAQVLSTAGSCGVIGTLGNGFPGDLQPGTHTTPDPVDLQSVLSDLQGRGADAVAMEVSSHALDQGRVEAIHFDIAVLTNLSRDHLDYHGTMEEYGASKLRLFQMPGLRCAILNLDDPFGHEVLQQLSAGVPAVGYGLQRPELLPDRLDGWIWAEEIETDGNGMQVRLNTSRGDGTFHSALLGRFNVSNLMSVLAVLLFQGVPLSEALQRLSTLRTVAGRMERFGGGEQPLVVVDYAHTPDALKHALQAARDHTAGRLICVFGCGGDRDRGKRPQMGAIAERYADRVIVTDDNPRTEDGDRIVADILAGMDQPDSARVVRDRAAAIHGAVADGTAGDLVLICGKGHEDYQLVGDQRLHFCDREQVRAALGVAA
jgi:UDP-N-acetylmuramoyl-L-alanyl-D-glutamate--2,6-diaminopimelate ligase